MISGEFREAEQLPIFDRADPVEDILGSLAGLVALGVLNEQEASLALEQWFGLE